MDLKNPVTQNIIFNYHCEEFLVARRVTLVAVFGFSRWRGPTYSTLSFYEDTQILPTVIEFECFGLTGGEDTKRFMPAHFIPSNLVKVSIPDANST